MMQFASRAALAAAFALSLQACRNEPYDPSAAGETSSIKDAGASGIETAAGGVPTTIHVSTRGSDVAAGNLNAPVRTLTRAIGLAGPGTTILVHAGTYNEHIESSKSGTKASPITVAGAGDGLVTISSSLPAVACTAREPVRNRTIELTSGADYWTFRNLTVVGGITVSGSNTGDNLKVQLGNRSLPGRGTPDLTGARTTLSRLGSDPAVGHQFLNLTVRGRGIYGVAARAGKIEDSDIGPIKCATGGGIWLGRFSDEWSIKRNRVHDLAESFEHFMSEGIRFSGASDYNLVEGNTVETIEGKGRGITTDVFASFNTIRANTVRGAAIGYSEQLGGWGNKWLDNTAENNSRTGYAVFVMGNQTAPSDPGTPSGIEFRGNRSVGDVVALQMGGIKRSSFSTNRFSQVSISPLLRSYWRAQGNSWNGAPNPPPQ
ncbi:MAG: DUF1565 domain-containing protein [Gemmatimonadetes bacterium]|nr:DUF1565 domain-containing protein [Gemmatimonadota bacterium]